MHSGGIFLIFAFLSLTPLPQDADAALPWLCGEECLRLANLRLKKQQERQKVLDDLHEKYTLNEDYTQIVDLPFNDLIDRLQTRQLKAVQVLSAFMAMAANVTREFNCVTEFVPDAMERAKELDAMDGVKGPFHGLPIGVKDDFDVKGMDSTLGYSKRLYKPAKESAVIVKILEDLGAVIFLKTNVPQTLMSAGGGNPIFGEALNPLNKQLSTGGSTSGGACLVAAGALKVTTGTDLGGSVRIPAHYNGISSIKTTDGRLSYKGIESALPNIVGMNAVVGLLGDKPSTLATVYENLVQNNRQIKYDSNTLRIPWNSSLYESKNQLRIGYFTSLPIFPAMGDTPGTILKAKDVLESLGHTLIPFEDIIDSYASLHIYADLMTADGGRHFNQMLKDDEVSNSFKTFKFILSVPAWKRRLISTFIPLPERIRMTISAGVDNQRAATLWDKVGEKEELVRGILADMKKMKLDLLIGPVMPFPAPKAEVAPNLFLGAAYTSAFNLGPFAAGVVPFGFESGQGLGNFNDEGDFILRLAKDNFNASSGMPIGVQVIGKPFEDELVIRVMRELDENRVVEPQPVLKKI